MTSLPEELSTRPDRDRSSALNIGSETARSTKSTPIPSASSPIMSQTLRATVSSASAAWDRHLVANTLFARAPYSPEQWHEPLPECREGRLRFQLLRMVSLR